MKALHIISGGDSGGAKTHVFALLDALKKYIGVKIICLTPGVFYQEIVKKEIPVMLIEQKNRFDLSVVGQIASVIQQEDFSLVHVHGARANFIATLLKGKIKVPIITTVHSDYKMDFTDSLYKRLIFTGINMVALRFADYYIGVSKNFKDMLIRRGFAPNRIFTIYNGMDYSTPISIMKKEEFIEKYPFPYEPDCTYVGIIGRFDTVKGHDVFLKGAASVLKQEKKVRFLLAGEGPEREKLEQLARELGIEKQVHFLGFVRDIDSFIDFIHINTLTSYSESFPYVLLEGARLKKATVSSRVGGISDLISDGENGFLFQNKNHEEFAQKLLILIRDTTLNKKMGEALFQVATTKFSSENLAKTHLDIYERVSKSFGNPKEYDVVMSGYYGFNNSGDDALLYAIIENLTHYKKDIRILTLSASPKATMEQFQVDAKNRFNPISIYRALKQSRLFINGGGTLIHDSTSNKSLWYYLTLIKLAKKMGLPVVVYANGFGPLKEKNEPKAAKVTQQADLITLRDDLSLHEVRRIGVTNPNVYLTADPAVTLSPISKEEVLKILKEEGLPQEEPFLAISVRSWNKNDRLLEKKIAAFADTMYETYHTPALFLPMKFSEDYGISKSIISQMKSPGYLIKKEYHAQEMMGIVTHCRLLVGMRLHALIYATTVAVPVIGLVYDPKVKGFLSYINQERTFQVSDLDLTAMIASAKDVFKNRESIKKSLMENAQSLKDKAMENARLTIEVLEKKEDE